MRPILLLSSLLTMAATFLYSQSPVILTTPKITTGLSQPIQLVNAGDGSGRFFIVQKEGSIRTYDADFNFLSTFLTVPGINTGGEEGLLSLAFHPDYETNGFFYVYYVNDDGNLELARYSVSADPNVATAASGAILITIPHPTNGNHNGGELHFGQDGNLYLSTGDGGGGGDIPNNAQSTTVLLGKILRFAVNTSNVAPYYTIPAGNPFGNEIYDRGLRNPFRWSFDKQTGDMWIGDVGQASFEEINFRLAASAPGVNYGWRCYEGNDTYNTAGCGPASDYLAPVYNYPTVSPAAVTGGVVYRGNVFPALNGYYIAADFFSGTAYLTRPNGSGGFVTTTQPLSPTGIADFGEAENGEVYAVSLTGNSVFQIITNVGAPLPVTLVDFSGQAINATEVKLDWNTSMEEDITAFEIGHSTDGVSFKSVGIVTARNDASGAAYSYVHADADAAQNFYRLKILENDGSASFSQVVRIDMSRPGKRLIYPSLVRDGIINIVADNVSYELVELYGMSGALLYRKNIRGMTGNIKVNIGNQHPKGMYIVRLIGNGNTISSKIVLQ